MLRGNRVPRVEGQATHTGKKNGDEVFAFLDRASGRWYIGEEPYGIFQPTCQPPQELKPISAMSAQTTEGN